MSDQPHQQVQQIDPPKRKRTPSQYASQIAQLKNTTSQLIRQPKPTKNRPNPVKSSPFKAQTQCMPCILPNGRKIKLTLVLDSGRPKPAPAKKTALKVKQEKQKVKQEKQQGKTLLQKLLSVCQELVKNEQEEGKENQQARAIIEEKPARMGWTRQEKWVKAEERFRALKQRFQAISDNLTVLQ